MESSRNGCETNGKREKERDREIGREREIGRARERERQTDRETDRERERDRDREIERERETRTTHLFLGPACFLTAFPVLGLLRRRGAGLGGAGVGHALNGLRRGDRDSRQCVGRWPRGSEVQVGGGQQRARVGRVRVIHGCVEFKFKKFKFTYFPLSQFEFVLIGRE